MPNEAGRAYGLTTLCPIRHGSHDKRSFASITRQVLQDQPIDDLAASPMAKVPNTYLCRFFVLSNVAYQGKPAILEGLKSQYLVFIAELHGDRDQYLKGMWNHAHDFVKEAWKYCVDFESVDSADGFAKYIARCQVETTFYFNGSTDDPLPEQLKALYLKQEFSRFAFESVSKSEEDLQRDFKAFVAETKPTELAAPTWRPGAVDLSNVVVQESEIKS